MDALLRKPEPTPLSRGCRPQYCSLQIFKRAGVLLAFHVLNILVAIGGVISVVLLLASMVLMPIWVVIISVLDAIQRLQKVWLVYFAFAVLVVLLVVLHTVLQAINLRLAGDVFLVIFAGAMSMRLFFRCTNAMKTLVIIDVKLANFVTVDDSNAHDPDEYQDGFEISEIPHGGCVLPLLLLTRHVWLAVIYFAVFKLTIGVLSTAVLSISVGLPALVLFSGGNVSMFVDESTFSGNPITYTVLAITVWLVGIVGVSVMVALSVKVTFWVCDVSQQQTEVETPVTPSPELTATNFAESDPSTYM